MGDLKASTINSFNPPGYPYQDDKLSPQQKAQWSRIISGWMNDEINGAQPGRTPLTQFFNGTVTPYNTDQKPALISWVAFPNRIRLSTNTDAQRWETADSSRYNQDEYCEWTVKNDGNNIVSVTFTCEGPEYWQFLSQSDPQKMLELYKEYNPEFAGDMKIDDMFKDTKRKVYQPYNKWNGVVTKDGNERQLITTEPGCIMHLAQNNNTLGAEIDIAAQGTVIRKDKNGKTITDPVKLCNCSQYGIAERNSDPKIGASINSLVRSGNSVSIADPVAIYMVDFNSSSFKLDQDGTGDNLVDPPQGTFTWVRGDFTKAMGLRLRIQIPDGIKGTGVNEGRQMTVSDLIDTNNNSNVQFGAQFADYILMGVKGVVNTGAHVAEPLACPGESANGNGDANGQQNENTQVFARMASADGPTEAASLNEDLDHHIFFRARR